jgi:integrase
MRARSKSPCLSHAWLRRRIKLAVSRLGLDHALYSCHSLRAGGATDLFAARVPYPMIKRMGRWKSDVCLIYYRDMHDVHRAVFSGFRSLAVRLQR